MIFQELYNKMLLRTLGKFVIIIGLIGIIVGFFGGMFLTTSVGSVHIGVETTSDTFHLNAGNTYTLAAVRSDWPMGGGSGELILHYLDGTTSYSYNFGYNFAGDATYSVFTYGEISVAESGTYYLEFLVVQQNIYAGRISIELQEPIVQSVTGINNSTIFFGSLLILATGIVLFIISSKQKSQSNVPLQKRYPSSSLNGHYSEIKCPMCGKISDGEYCDDCGSSLR